MGWTATVGWSDDQSFKEVVPGTVASYTDSVPQPSWARHLLYEMLVRGTVAATTVGLGMAWGAGTLDTTTGNYHNQRIGGTNNSITALEATTYEVATIAASQAVANYYSTVWVVFPWYKHTQNKQAMVMFAAERAALDQIVALANTKRQGGSIVGAESNAVQQVRFLAGAGGGNLDILSLRRKLVA